jgi:hypothetical protein
VVPETDPSQPSRWRLSQERSIVRRARSAARARLRRRVIVAAFAFPVALAPSGIGLAAAAEDETGGAGAGLATLGGGGSVKALQRALGVPADGVYGPRTRRAVRAFQRRQGLEVDGIAGPRTRAALGLSSRRGRTARRRAAGRAPNPAAVSPTLERIAMCESGGDPTRVSASGRYRGKYQFSTETWRDLGGSGDPAAAPEAEQDRRAALLLARRGTAPWPSCA